MRNRHPYIPTLRSFSLSGGGLAQEKHQLIVEWYGEVQLLSVRGALYQVGMSGEVQLLSVRGALYQVGMWGLPVFEDPRMEIHIHKICTAQQPFQTTPKLQHIKICVTRVADL